MSNSADSPQGPDPAASDGGGRSGVLDGCRVRPRRADLRDQLQHRQGHQYPHGRLAAEALRPHPGAQPQERRARRVHRGAPRTTSTPSPSATTAAPRPRTPSSAPWRRPRAPQKLTGQALTRHPQRRPAERHRPAPGYPEPQPNDLVIHQQDLQAVVNALWQGGAKGIQVMDQRLISTSAVRCVGNTLILQGRVYSPPYKITAVGDPERAQEGARRVPGDPELPAVREGLRARLESRRARGGDSSRLLGHSGSPLREACGSSRPLRDGGRDAVGAADRQDVQRAVHHRRHPDRALRGVRRCSGPASRPTAPWTARSTGSRSSGPRAPVAAPPQHPAPGARRPRAAPAPAPARTRAGRPFAVMYIPRFGSDWDRPVLEGTATGILKKGLGHYAAHRPLGGTRQLLGRRPPAHVRRSLQGLPPAAPGRRGGADRRDDLVHVPHRHGALPDLPTRHRR